MSFTPLQSTTGITLPIDTAPASTTRGQPGPHLSALLDHLGPGARCEFDDAPGRARLISSDGRRTTDIRFSPRDPDERGIERLTAGALHLLKRSPAIVPREPEAMRRQRLSYWPLPGELVLDADVLRSGQRIIGRLVAGEWRYDLLHLAELTALPQPLTCAPQPVARWEAPNLYGRAAEVRTDLSAPAAAASHDRLYVVQLNQSMACDVKPKDLKRTRVLQMDEYGDHRLAEAPHVAPWTGSTPPTVRLVLIGGSMIDQDSGSLQVAGRSPQALAATAVEAMRVLSDADGLQHPAAPQHISLVACYLDNGAFGPFGARFLEALSGATGFNDPSLTVTVRTNGVYPGEGEDRGRLLVLGSTGDKRHRPPGGAVRLALLDGQVQATDKVAEDGRSFVADTGQESAPLLDWWRPPPRPNAPVRGTTSFLMGEVAVSIELLERMGVPGLTGDPQGGKGASMAEPGACLDMRFDARRLKDFMNGSSPTDVVQALRLFRQNLRARPDMSDIFRGDPGCIRWCDTWLSHVGRAVDEDLMVPPSLWIALWPSGEAPEVPLRPARQAPCRETDSFWAVSRARNARAGQFSKRKLQLAQERDVAKAVFESQRADDASLLVTSGSPPA
ncbi:hypothetical protein CDL60_01140 [Roseateles noduli]|nr:hypothetical protein CDL60_01140 [Roseateles noduli]